MYQLLATLCVTSSLALVALGGSDPAGGFHLQTLSFGIPHAIVRPVLDTVTIPCNVEGALYKESGDA
jgi:hypothetical protein